MYLFKIVISATFHHATKIILNFLSYDFTIVTGDGFVSGFDSKYKAHSLFIVSVPLEKPIRSACLGTVTHNWASVV